MTILDLIMKIALIMQWILLMINKTYMEALKGVRYAEKKYLREGSIFTNSQLLLPRLYRIICIGFIR